MDCRVFGIISAVDPPRVRTLPEVGKLKEVSVVAQCPLGAELALVENHHSGVSSSK